MKHLKYVVQTFNRNGYPVDTEFWSNKKEVEKFLNWYYKDQDKGYHALYKLESSGRKAS